MPRPGVCAGARQSAELARLRRRRRRTAAADRLCALCAGPQSQGLDRRPSLLSPTTSSSHFDSPMARAQLAASLALYGEQQRAGSDLRNALSRLLKARSENYYRTDYGSRLRDGAAMLALAAETKPMPPSVAGDDRLCDRRARGARPRPARRKRPGCCWRHAPCWPRAAASRSTSTARRMQGNYDRTFAGPQTRADAADGDQCRRRRCGRRGDGHGGCRSCRCRPADTASRSSEPITHLDGIEADISQVAQNERFVVVIKVTQTTTGRRACRHRSAAGRLRDRQSEPRPQRGSRELRLAGGDRRRRISSSATDRFVAALDRNPEETGRVHPRLCGAGGVARHLRPSGGDGRGHVPAAVQARTATGRMEVKGRDAVSRRSIRRWAAGGRRAGADRAAACDLADRAFPPPLAQGRRSVDGGDRPAGAAAQGLRSCPRACGGCR